MEHNYFTKVPAHSVILLLAKSVIQPEPFVECLSIVKNEWSGFTMISAFRCIAIPEGSSFHFPQGTAVNGGSSFNQGSSHGSQSTGPLGSHQTGGTSGSSVQLGGRPAVVPVRQPIGGLKRYDS